MTSDTLHLQAFPKQMPTLSARRVSLAAVTNRRSILTGEEVDAQDANKQECQGTRSPYVGKGQKGCEGGCRGRAQSWIYPRWGGGRLALLP